MNLQEALLPYLQAGFAGNWVLTHEPEEAQREITLLAHGMEAQLMVWDCDKGIYFPREDKPNDPKSKDPLVALRTAVALQMGRDDLPPMLVVLHNLHFFFRNPEVVQTMHNAILRGKQYRIYFLVLAPVLQLPLELEKAFRIVEHKLPGPEHIRNIAEGLPEDAGDRTVTERVLQAARGLTRREIEDAFSLSLTLNARLDADIIWGLKTQAVAKKGHLQVYRGQESFQSLGGLEGLKGFTRKLLRPGVPYPARGVLLLGPSGTGKSHFAKALGDETGRATMLLDMGRMHHKHVGQSEENMREALAMADAMAPCILFLDEVEKGLAGVGGEGDAGVATRLFGHLLTWLQDHTSDVFCVFTSNNIEALPPEFSRAERWDGIWFLDLPDRAARQKIWQLYMKQFFGKDYTGAGVETIWEQISDEGWTGAEIRSCCRLSSMLDEPLKDAATRIIPVAVSSRDRVEKLREWAKHRCLDAATGKVYEGTSTGSNHLPRRQITKSIERS